MDYWVSYSLLKVYLKSTIIYVRSTKDYGVSYSQLIQIYFNPTRTYLRSTKDYRVWQSLLNVY